MFKLHPANVYPSLVGSLGHVAYVPYAFPSATVILSIVAGVPPFVSNVTWYVFNSVAISLPVFSSTETTTIYVCGVFISASSPFIAFVAPEIFPS